MRTTTETTNLTPSTRANLKTLSLQIQAALEEMRITYHRAKDPMRLFNVDDDTFDSALRCAHQYTDFIRQIADEEAGG